MDRAHSRLIARGLNRWTELDARDYASLLHVGGDYAVVERQVTRGDWMAGRTVRELALRDRHVLLLGIDRSAPPPSDQRRLAAWCFDGPQARQRTTRRVEGCAAPGSAGMSRARSSPAVSVGTGRSTRATSPVTRSDGTYFGVPGFEDEVREGDTLVVYGDGREVCALESPAQGGAADLPAGGLRQI